MIERLIQKRGDDGKLRSVMAQVPEASDVAAVAVGGQHPTCFGGVGLVTRIAYTGKDRDGFAYVGYVTALSENDTAENGCGCSNSIKEGRLIRSVALTGFLNSAECDRLEWEMQKGTVCA